MLLNNAHSEDPPPPVVIGKDPFGSFDGHASLYATKVTFNDLIKFFPDGINKPGINTINIGGQLKSLFPNPPANPNAKLSFPWATVDQAKAYAGFWVYGQSFSFGTPLTAPPNPNPIPTPNFPNTNIKLFNNANVAFERATPLFTYLSPTNTEAAVIADDSLNATPGIGMNAFGANNLYYYAVAISN